MKRGGINLKENLEVDKDYKLDEDIVLNKAISKEGLISILAMALIFGGLGSKMGLANFVNTLINTSYDLLMNTVFYIMAIAVIAGGFAKVLTEFGIIAIFNKLLSPLMGPIYGLPGAGIVSIFATYLSDNPAILPLAEDIRFRRYFKKYQMPALTNLGTSFGMGLLVAVFMIGLDNPNNEPIFQAVVVGNLAAVIGSVVSVRLMLRQTKKAYGLEEEATEVKGDTYDILEYREVSKGSIGERLLNSLLEGGASGVQVGFDIIPGVLIICTIILLLSNGMPVGGYTGAAGEGVGLLNIIGEKLSFIINPLFGFTSAEAIAVPITALGAAGASIGLIPGLFESGLVHANDIAVFTAMCMCWSGYLSTHVAMMDSLDFRDMTSKAIMSHTVGGIVAGISANWIFKLLMIL